MASRQSPGGLTGHRRCGLDGTNCYNVTFTRCMRQNLGSMGWFRSNRRLWAWAALFALFVQFGMSFGHVHGIGGIQPSAAQAASPGSVPSPHHDSGDPDNDYCAICAVQALLSGAQVAHAPAIALPIARPLSEQPFALTTLLAEPVRVAFRSRAPPPSLTSSNRSAAHASRAARRRAMSSGLGVLHAVPFRSWRSTRQFCLASRDVFA